MKRKFLCLLLAIGCMASLLCGCSNFALNNLAGLFGGSEASNLPETDIPSSEKVEEETHIQIIIPSDGEEDEADKPNYIIIMPGEDEDDNDKPVGCNSLLYQLWRKCLYEDTSLFHLHDNDKYR